MEAPSGEPESHPFRGRIMIDGIDVVFLHATKSEETARWYSEVLGLDFGYQAPDLSWQEVDFSKAPPTRFAIERTTGRVSDVEEQGIMLSFRVRNLSTTVETLTQRGVQFYGRPRIREEGQSLFATLRDPEGNWIQLSQRKEQIKK
jgi:extradiol dioxygenase family protein